jgi:hypothetical protein
MQQTTVSFIWQQPGIADGFRTAACLHGHTLHSEECLSFLPRYLDHVPGLSKIVNRHRPGSAPAVDFARAYWTPPLTPASALRLERQQIARLGLRPLVSLTDHDNIEAPMALQVATRASETPVSVEWTVPYRRTILHLGIHNLPPQCARAWLRVMQTYTAAPVEERLPEMLSELDRIPEVLIVLNHPFWLEEGVTESDHQEALPHALTAGNRWFHAFELNGTRQWSENRAVVDLARQWARPVISGGDRHACEPAACLNLTNAANFSEFAGQVRGGCSSVLFMHHYQEPMPVRMMEAIWDILRPYPEYPDRERWTDRIFYRSADEVPRPLSVIWKDRIPWEVRPATALLKMIAAPGVKHTLRYLLSAEAEVVQ